MLVSLALDAQRADVGTRERYHVGGADAVRVYRGSRTDGLEEVAVLATCHRVELYAWCGFAASETRALDRLAARWVGDGGDAHALRALATSRSGIDAARHLFRVAAGLESPVLGDAQILGQVRRAYHDAVEADAVGSALHRLFHTALRGGKRVRRETALAMGRASVGAVAASYLAQHGAPLGSRRCVVVGAGKTATQAARQLAKLGARQIVIVNRTAMRAEALARDVGGRAAPFDALADELARADLAVVATAALAPIVEAEALARARDAAETNGRALLLVDLSVPRNVEADVAALPGLTLVDVDALRPAPLALETDRAAAVPAAAAIVEEELAGFLTWVHGATARQAIQPLRDLLDELCRRELAFAGGEAIAAQAAERIVTKLLSRPMVALRAAAERGESVPALADSLRRLFEDPAADAPSAETRAPIEGP